LKPSSFQTLSSRRIQVPYNCIVVVPGPHPDDRCVINPQGMESAMPIIKPELRFIPWNAAK
jgi:hypothetical protein